MQDDSGLKKILSISWAYHSFQRLLGERKARRWLTENYLRLNGGEKVVDIGCGPGGVLNYLPKNVTYIGLDVNERYIKAAQRLFGERATFIVGAACDFLGELDSRLTSADVVLCNGLLHHLDDKEATEVLQLSKQVMSDKGRLVIIEPTFLAHQDVLSRWIIAKDRGRNVRYEKEWKDLIGRVFDCFSTAILTGLIRIPYVHIVIECWISTHPITALRYRKSAGLTKGNVSN
ncbi:MAG: class I SAM-dependent methyltransferase [Nitrososphaera sp.]|nr:class I SAM-dependent methyltransferase [Nitrososphaera sp.]